MIDESILAKDFYRVNPDRTRRLFADACTFIIFFCFHTAKSLTAEERLRAIAKASRSLRDQWMQICEKLGEPCDPIRAVLSADGLALFWRLSGV